MIEELPIVWLRPSLYVVWALWAALIIGLFLVFGIGKVTTSHATVIVVFFSLGGLIAANQSYKGEPWGWFELVGTAKQNSMNAFLLSVVHGFVTAAAAICGGHLSNPDEQTTETT
ncbi:hypothetical protein [uncultured Tateyamaria sp.]|uniref:hypothetical protein n=1 Tax=uncultured Tateyamaria sp. TaxID=455651 RepID=UPI00260729D9|nr:hypothetical protein [uncultured Tateyamaria sp.]